MKNQMSSQEKVTYRRTSITLYQDNDGFWGWVIGNDTLIPTLKYRDIAFGSAKRHVDESK